MNEFEIDTCNPNTTVLKNAAMFLRDFKNLINEISDGWAYWKYGTKCSKDLQTIVKTAPIDQKNIDNAAVKKAQNKIIRFLSTCSQTKENQIVKDFIASKRK